MIYLLHGENSFEKAERLRALLADFDGELERVDGELLDLGQLRDLLQGQTLFSGSRAVIISDLSESDVWQSLPDVETNSDNLIILLEQKVDKRTKTYKWLQKNANVQELPAWGDKDRSRAISWSVTRAKEHYGYSLSQSLASSLVARLGPDQMRLDGVLRQLELAGRVDQEKIDELVPLPKTENIFELFESVLTGRRQTIQDIVRYLEQSSGSDGAYQVVGLITSQLILLSGLILGGEPADVAKDLGGHPFVVKKLTSHARHMNIDTAKDIAHRLAWADGQMKSTNVNPWLILETALIGSVRRS